MKLDNTQLEQQQQQQQKRKEKWRRMDDRLGRIRLPSPQSGRHGNDNERSESRNENLGSSSKERREMQSKMRTL